MLVLYPEEPVFPCFCVIVPSKKVTLKSFRIWAKIVEYITHLHGNLVPNMVPMSVLKF